MPYKDTFDHKGPLVYLFFWAGRQIATWRGVWVLYLGMIFLALLLIFQIFRRFCSRRVSALLMLVIFAVSFDYAIENMSPENMTIPFMACALYIFIDYFLFDIITKKRLLLTGFCFGCVLMIKAQMVSVWFVFCIAVLIKNIMEKTLPKIIPFLAFFLAGCLAVVVPVCVWLKRGGAWKDFIDDYIVFNMEYSRSYSGSTPVESMVAKTRAMLFFLNKPVVLFCLFLCAALFALDRSNRFFHASYLAYILLSVAVAALAGRTYRHYGASLLVAVSWPLAVFASRAAGAASVLTAAGFPGNPGRDASGDPKGIADISAADGTDTAFSGDASGRLKKPQWLSGALFLGLAYLVCVYAAPVFFTKADNALTIYESYSKGETALSSNLQGILDVIAKNTTEDDTITVHALYDIIYGKSERLSASKYTYQHAFAAVDPARNDEYFAELEANPPKLIIQGDPEPERMMEFAASHGYHWIATSENGEFRIYKRYDKADDPDEEWMDTLRTTDSFTEYLDLLHELEKKQGIVVYMAVKGKPGDELSIENAAQLQALGFHDADTLLDESYHTFLGVSKWNESLYESIGGNGADQYTGELDGVDTSLISATKRRGNQASIVLGGIEYALNERGFNIVVYDPEASYVIDSVTFDPHDEEITCTR